MQRNVRRCTEQKASAVDEFTQEELESQAAQVGAILQDRRWRLVTAESCTGGWIAQAVTAIAGSSQWFDRGFVTYSNEAKCDLLGVQAATLQSYGAVSEEVVTEMARGALRNGVAQISVAVSGIAGPGGAVPNKPVGTVWFAWATREGALLTRCEIFSGSRSQVRAQAVAAALRGLGQLARDGR